MISTMARFVLKRGKLLSYKLLVARWWMKRSLTFGDVDSVMLIMKANPVV